MSPRSRLLPVIKSRKGETGGNRREGMGREGGRKRREERRDMWREKVTDGKG